MILSNILRYFSSFVAKYHRLHNNPFENGKGYFGRNFKKKKWLVKVKVVIDSHALENVVKIQMDAVNQFGAVDNKLFSVYFLNTDVESLFYQFLKQEK